MRTAAAQAMVCRQTTEQARAAITAYQHGRMLMAAAQKAMLKSRLITTPTHAAAKQGWLLTAQYRKTPPQAAITARHHGAAPAMENARLMARSHAWP